MFHGWTGIRQIRIANGSEWDDEFNTDHDGPKGLVLGPYLPKCTIGFLLLK